jgi:hypothetical protein
MLNWIGENGSTLLVAGVLAALVAAIVIHLWRNKKKGRFSCGCSCGGCPMNGSCHSSH